MHYQKFLQVDRISVTTLICLFITFNYSLVVVVIIKPKKAFKYTKQIWEVDHSKQKFSYALPSHMF